MITTTTELLAQLNRRYAVKQFDKDRKLSNELVVILLESLRLSPSSMWLQGRWFVHVTDMHKRNEIVPYARNQTQVIDSSDLIVLCRRTDVHTDFVNHYIDSVATARWQEVNQLNWYKNMILSFLENRNAQDIDHRLTNQVYLALWILLTSCAMLDVDACPMEWFDHQKCDEILWLSTYNLASCVLVPIGYRSFDDPYASKTKVRFDRSEVVFRV